MNPDTTPDQPATPGTPPTMLEGLRMLLPQVTDLRSKVLEALDQARGQILRLRAERDELLRLPMPKGDMLAELQADVDRRADRRADKYARQIALDQTPRNNGGAHRSPATLMTAIAAHGKKGTDAGEYYLLRELMGSNLSQGSFDFAEQCLLLREPIKQALAVAFDDVTWPYEETFRLASMRAALDDLDAELAALKAAEAEIVQSAGRAGIDVPTTAADVSKPYEPNAIAHEQAVGRVRRKEAEAGAVTADR